MSYTVETLSNDTYERLCVLNGPQAPSLVPRLATLIPSALRLLPIRIRERFGEIEAETYRTSESIDLVDGEGIYGTLVAAAEGALIPSDIVKVTHTDAVTDSNRDGRLKEVGSSSLLDLERSTEYAYFAIEDNRIYTMMNNDRTALNGELIVRAGFVPSLGSVKVQHEPMLLECMIELAQPMIQKAA